MEGIEKVHYVCQHWDDFVTYGTATVAVLTHVRALVPMPAIIGKAIDKVVGNYGKAANAE